MVEVPDFRPVVVMRSPFTRQNNNCLMQWRWKITPGKQNYKYKTYKTEVRLISFCSQSRTQLTPTRS